MALTETALVKFKIKDKPYTVNDMDGLSIHITPNGTKSWHFRFSWQGKQPRISLGTYPTLSLKEARTKRDAMHALIANGIDPRAQKAKAKSIVESKQPTFKEFIPEWKELKFKKLGFADPTHVQISDRIGYYGTRY